MSTPEAMVAPPVVAPRAPDWLDRLGSRLAERSNPIVVKELRQHLRTKTFWVFFSLMLLGCLVIAMVASVVAGESDDVGLGTFIALFVALSGVQHFVIPYTAYRSMAREQEDETWVLLTLTGLGPRRILAGKVTSFVLQGALYASAAAPFLLFSYYLNGIDLPTIAVAVTLGAVFQVFLVSVSVSMATLAESRLMRALLHFAVLGGLAVAVTLVISAVTAVAKEMPRSSGAPLFWLVTGGAAFFLVTTALLLFEAAAARLSMPTEPYAAGPRVVFTVQALGGLGLFIGGWLLEGEDGILGGGLVVFILQVSLVGLFLASDRDSMAKNHWARHGRFSLLAPGALRGYVLVLLVLLVGISALVGAFAHDESQEPALLNLILAAPAYLLLYLGASLVIARWIPHPPWQTPAMVRLVALGLVTVGSGVPPLVGSIVSKPDDRALNVLNPIVGLVNAANDGVDGFTRVLVVAAAAAMATTAALVTLGRRDVRWE